MTSRKNDRGRSWAGKGMNRERREERQKSELRKGGGWQALRKTHEIKRVLLWTFRGEGAPAKKIEFITEAEIC